MVPNQRIGNFVSIKHGYAFAGEYFSKEEQSYILLTPGNFHIDQKLYFGANTKYYNGPIYDDYILSNGDLLIVMTDLTKNMAILGNAVILNSVTPVLHNQRIGLVETKEEVSKEYLCYLFNSEHVRKHIKVTASGTTVRHTSPTKILDIKAYFPPLAEQQKIAKILTTWDKAISATERLIDNNQQQKKALMQQLLTGKQRLLDDSGERFSGEWEELSLESIFPVIDSLHLTPKFSDKGYPMIRVADIKGGNLNLNNALLVNENVFKEYTKKYKPKKGDIVFSRVGSYGNSSIVNTDEAFCLGQNTVVASSNNTASSSFIYQFLNTNFIKRQIENVVDGSSHKTVSLKVIRNLKIKIPTILEQQKIATVLTNADREIELLQQQLADLQQEKKALMQQLLTGKRRVLVD